MQPPLVPMAELVVMNVSLRMLMSTRSHHADVDDPIHEVVSRVVRPGTRKTLPGYEMEYTGQVFRPDVRHCCRALHL